MARDRIEINKSLIPYTFDIVLGAEEYTFRVDYNNTGEFFTVELSKDGKTLCSGEPIIYGKRLFSDIRTPEFPAIDIVPIDPSGEYNAVTFENLCNGVILALDNEEEPLAEG